jgi:hypothetical protein
MNMLKEDLLDAFLQRFNSFNDGVLRSITLVYPTERARSATILLSTKDSQGTADEGWVNLVIRLSDLLLFRVTESDFESYQILSNSLNIGVYDGAWHVDLGSFGDPPPDKATFLESNVLLVAKTFEWESLPYQG